MGDELSSVAVLVREPSMLKSKFYCELGRQPTAVNRLRSAPEPRERCSTTRIIEEPTVFPKLGASSSHLHFHVSSGRSLALVAWHRQRQYLICRNDSCSHGKRDQVRLRTQTQLRKDISAMGAQSRQRYTQFLGGASERRMQRHYPERRNFSLRKNTHECTSFARAHSGANEDTPRQNRRHASIELLN